MMNNKKGFSLIEIVIFFFIGITLMSLIIGLAANSRDFARTIGCVNNMKNIGQAIENFQADFNTSPVNLDDLYPQYIENYAAFKCPSDMTAGNNSYEKFYIGRFFAKDDPGKIFLACPRHNKGNKTVSAYLSYGVDIGDNKKVQWNGQPAEYGAVFTGGELAFADGTKATITSGQAGLVASFTSTSGRLYSIIYTPEAATGTVEVVHETDSIFEVITPAVIAGVEGTRFSVNNSFDGNSFGTNVSVDEGAVHVENRLTGISSTSTAATSVSVGIEKNLLLPPGLAMQVPRKPLPPGWRRKLESLQ